jgi:hypothetical protein
MIISHILGGIGNQMFQYAAGRSLSLNLNDDYFLDLNDFDRYRLHHGFELKRVFDLTIRPAKSSHVYSTLGLRSLSLTRKFLRIKLLRAFRGQHFIVEPHFNFWPEFFDIKSNGYLQGYWQSEKYFKQIESTIRKDFSFKLPLVGQNKSIANKISKVNAISLHIRRGDYVSDAKTRQVMSLLDESYYLDAISYITTKIQDPVFYIFSDDMDWVKQNITINYPKVYVEHNSGVDSYIDMQLMSLCKHHIIANSSFSWWGAWLNPTQNKIVIAPEKWFQNNNNDADLIPEGWVRL